MFRNWFFLAIGIGATAAGPARGQGAATASGEDNVARLVVFRPRPGHEADFEAGYRRHLEWHRRHNDPWTWLGWTVINGERSGWFMDGTFGHPWAHLDESVVPEQDRADNAANVDPYVDLMENAVYQLDARLSREPEAGLQAPLLTLVRVSLDPGGQHAFEARLAAIPQMGNSTGLPPSWAVLRLVSGGTPGRYLVLIGENRLADGALVSEWMDRLSGRKESSGVALPIREWQVETLVHRPDMSYRPGGR